MPEGKIGPSLLACDLSNVLSESVRVLSAGADFLHLDVMDGHFVPNITFGAPVIKCLRRNLPLPSFDVHLMVTEPEKWIDDMADAGATIFTFHIEAQGNPLNIINRVKARGMKVGIALKPATSVESVIEYLDFVDLILVMTVEPGFGGQKFMEEMMSKVASLRNMRPDLDIEVDGGLGSDTISTAVAAGANMIVAGSSVFKGDPKVNISRLKRAFVMG